MNARPLPFRRQTAVVCAVLLAAALAVPLDVFAAPKKKKNPVSKLYVADKNGEAEIDNGEKIEELKDKSVHDASGSAVQTKPDANSSIVYSNGAGVYLDPDTKMDVKSFIQEPFTPNRSDLEVEPSISRTEAVVAHGTVGLCTSKLVAGSKMVYRTPHASVNIRARRVVIQANDKETKISVVEGDVTVAAGENDVGGQILRAGQQAIIRPGAGPNGFTIQPIPAEEKTTVEDKVVKACMARRTVYFEVVDRKGNSQSQSDTPNSPTTVFDQDNDPSPPEIVPVPVVTPPPPTEKPISPSRFNG